MIVTHQFSHVANWLMDSIVEMVEDDMDENELSLLNHADDGIEQHIRALMQDALDARGEVIDGDSERMLISYGEFFFSIYIDISSGRSGNALEFEIKRFRTLDDAREDYNVI